MLPFFFFFTRKAAIVAGKVQAYSRGVCFQESTVNEQPGP